MAFRVLPWGSTFRTWCEAGFGSTSGYRGSVSPRSVHNPYCAFTKDHHINELHEGKLCYPFAQKSSILWPELPMLSLDAPIRAARSNFAPAEFSDEWRPVYAVGARNMESNIPY